MDKVKRLVSENRVLIFSKSNCCLSYAVHVLFQDLGANPVVCEIDKEPEGREMEKALVKLGCSSVLVPAVFIGDMVCASPLPVKSRAVSLDFTFKESNTKVTPKQTDNTSHYLPLSPLLQHPTLTICSKIPLPISRQCRLNQRRFVEDFVFFFCYHMRFSNVHISHILSSVKPLERSTSFRVGVN